MILREKIVAHHVVAEFDGGGETLGIGAAVAFDDDAVQAEKNPAIRRAADRDARAIARKPERANR